MSTVVRKSSSIPLRLSDLIWSYLTIIPRILYYRPLSYWELLRITTHYYILETLYTLLYSVFFWSMCHMSYNASTLWYTWCLLLLVIQLFTSSVWGLGLLWIEIWPSKTNYQMYLDVPDVPIREFFLADICSLHHKGISLELKSDRANQIIRRSCIHNSTGFFAPMCVALLLLITRQVIVQVIILNIMKILTTIKMTIMPKWAVIIITPRKTLTKDWCCASCCSF